MQLFIYVSSSLLDCFFLEGRFTIISVALELSVGPDI